MIDLATVDIKAELQALIANETDHSILEAIRTLLRKSSLDLTLKQKLMSRALKAEEDIATGRVMNRKELEKSLNSRLGR
ncbi:MAG: hypothetical protein RIG77_20230 [Cyclobacteriaceae bacterium]